MLLGAVPIGARRSIHPRVGAKLSVGPSNCHVEPSTLWPPSPRGLPCWFSARTSLFRAPLPNLRSPRPRRNEQATHHIVCRTNQ
jgi:hypothetical protein